MAIKYPRINLKTLNPDTLNMVYQEIRNYIYHSNELNRLTVGTAEWIDHYQKRKTNHAIIQTTSGLDERRLQDLIAGRTTMATYWLPSGEIRREKA
jgi:L-fucose mutarotase/ribose pyranase (RbsD/FucU family)